MKLIIDIDKDIYINIVDHDVLDVVKVCAAIKKGEALTDFGAYMDGYLKGWSDCKAESEDKGNAE